MWILLARSASASDERVQDWVSRLFRLGFPLPVNLEGLPPRAVLSRWAQYDPLSRQVFLPPSYLLPLAPVPRTLPPLGTVLDAVLLDRRARLLYVTERMTLEFNWGDPASYQKIKDRQRWRPEDQVDGRTFPGSITHEWHPIPDPWGLGTRHPRAWILAEESNPHSWAHPLPLVSASGLPMVWDGLDPWQVRVSNVLMPPGPYRNNGADSPARLERDWYLLGTPQVIVLGRVAASVVLQTRIEPWAYLDHPQYVWRFHHASILTWQQELARCLREILHEENHANAEA